MFDIGLFLHLARVFGVIPFSSVEKNKISVSKWTLRSSFLVQSAMVVLYMIYSYERYLPAYSLSGEVRLTVTNAIGFVVFFIDHVNVWNIVFMSQKLPSLLNTMSKNFHFFDEHTPEINRRRSKIRACLFTVQTAAVIVVKTGLLFYHFDHFKLSFNIGARFIYGMILVLEQLISLLTLELFSRYKLVNQKLRRLKGQTNLIDVRLLHDLYKALIENSSILAQSCGRFFLLDLSQMFMLIINGFLNLFLVCLPPQSNNAPYCVSRILFALDCLWRFCFITRNCGILHLEVRSYRICDLCYFLYVLKMRGHHQLKYLKNTITNP